MNMKKKFNLNDFRGFFKAGNPGMMTAFDDIMTKKEAVQSPYILEEGEMHVTQMDIFSRLMGERQVFFASEVDDYSASITIAQLLYLDSQSDTDITMYIMTGGGSCSAGLGICDTMNFIKSDIKTINVSMAASMGSLLLSSGTRGKRFSYLAQRTGQPYEKIFEDARRDFWLNAEECKKYGIIDEIIETKMD